MQALRMEPILRRIGMIVFAAMALGAIPFAFAVAQSTAPASDVVTTAPAKTASQADTDAQIAEWL